MVTIITSLVIALFSFLLTQWLPLPWYTPMIVAFILGLVLAKTKVKPFISGSLGVGLFWLIKVTLSYIVQPDFGVKNIAGVFTEIAGFTITPFILILATLLIGLLLGGLAMVSGKMLLSSSSNSNNSLRSGRKGKRSSSYKLKLN